MSKMFELVDELRQQLQSVGDTEQKLVSTLREALKRYDQRLLQDVRNLTAEHEARRGAILSELQSLASRMGAFPPAREPQLGVAGAAPREGAAALPAGAKLRAVPGGAWREATERLQSELDVYFKKRA
jgi:hypothetical protein